MSNYKLLEIVCQVGNKFLYLLKLCLEGNPYFHKMKKASLVILILLFCVSTEAQIKFYYGVEAGFCLTGLPRTFYEDANRKTSAYSIPGLLAGGFINTQVGNHFVFSLGAQYRKMNSSSFYHFGFNGYSNDLRYNEHYTKINFPATVGFQFGKQLHSTLIMGAELNYILIGKIDKIYIFSTDTAGVVTVETKQDEVNTFDKYFYNQSRIRGQAVVGFLMSVSKHIQIETGLYFGGPIEGVVPHPESTIYEIDYGSASDMYWNREFSISLKYFFKELYSTAPKKSLE